MPGAGLGGSDQTAVTGSQADASCSTRETQLYRTGMTTASSEFYHVHRLQLL